MRPKPILNTIPQNPFRLLKTKNLISQKETRQDTQFKLNRKRHYSLQAVTNLLVYKQLSYTRFNRIKHYCRTLKSPKRYTKFSTNIINYSTIANLAINRMANLQQFDLHVNDRIKGLVLLRIFKKIVRLPKLHAINIYISKNHEEDLGLIYKLLARINWQRYHLTPSGKWVKQAVDINLSLLLLSNPGDFNQIKNISNLSSLRIYSTASGIEFKNFLSRQQCLPSTIKQLRLGHISYKLSNSDLNYLLNCPKLEKLSLKFRSLRKRNLNILALQRNLTVLNLNDTGLQALQLANYISNLSDASQLTTLNIENNRELSSADFRSLVKLTNLQYLNLAGTNFNYNDLYYLTQNAKFSDSLIHLNLNFCPIICNVNYFFYLLNKSNFPLTT